MFDALRFVRAHEGTAVVTMVRKTGERVLIARSGPAMGRMAERGELFANEAAAKERQHAFEKEDSGGPKE
jgi:hypothetical protein